VPTTDLIFDFFGTLVHYRREIFRGASYERTHAFLLEQGFGCSYAQFEADWLAVSDAMETEARRTSREYSMLELARRFLQRMRDRPVPDALARALVEHFMAEWSLGVTYIAGLDRHIEALAGRYRLSVLSNTHHPDHIERHLESMGIATHFAQVVTSVELGLRKPHPAIFQHALQRLSTRPESAVYVGDTYIDDHQGAASAELRCVLIDPERKHLHQVTHRVNHIFELDALLTEIDGF
jgi:putative hydrolase of the HAD superfamily